jgi:hypothetical protein
MAKISMYLTFTNQADADNAAEKIWYNHIISVANNSEKIVGDGTNHYFLSDIQSMTEPQVCALSIYGKKEGVTQYASGLTTSYCTPFAADNDPNLFIFPKPDVSLMTGVVNYTEQEKDPDWFPQLNQ